MKQRKLIYILIGITLLTSFFMLLLFNYMDGQSIMVWSVNQWDLLVEGRFTDFYSDKMTNVRGAVHLEGMSNPFVLIPNMIWMFPVWVTHYFNGNLYVGTVLCVYWYKLFLLVVSVLCSYVIFLFVKDFTSDSNKAWLSFLFSLAGAEMIMGTMYAGQDENVYLLFMLLAFWFLYKEKKVLFFVSAIFTVTCCPIMLFPLLVLLLVYEKNILKIVAYILPTLVPTVFWELISNGYAWKGDMALDSAETIQELINLITFKSSTGNTSVSAILICVILIIAYFTHSEDMVSKVHNASWLLASSMVLISFLMESSYFYRYGLYIPFVVLLLFIQSEEKVITSNCFLLTILSYLRFFEGGHNCPMNMNTSYVVQTDWVKNLCQHFGSDKYQVNDSLVEKLIENVHILGSFETVFNAIILVLIAMVLLSTQPWKKIRFELNIPTWLSAIGYTLCMPAYFSVFFALLIHP